MVLHGHAHGLGGSSNVTSSQGPLRPGHLLFETQLPEEIPVGFLFEEDLDRGDENIDVVYLQLCLTSQGIFTEVVNGYFGPVTKRGVEEFQTLMGIDAEGFVGEQSRKKLNELCARPLEVIPEQPDIEEDIPKPPLFDVIVEPGEKPTELEQKFKITKALEQLLPVWAWVTLLILFILPMIIAIGYRRRKHSKKGSNYNK